MRLAMANVSRRISSAEGRPVRCASTSSWMPGTMSRASWRSARSASRERSARAIIPPYRASSPSPWVSAMAVVEVPVPPRPVTATSRPRQPATTGSPDSARGTALTEPIIWVWSRRASSRSLRSRSAGNNAVTPTVVRSRPRPSSTARTGHPLSDGQVDEIPVEGAHARIKQHRGERPTRSESGTQILRRYALHELERQRSGGGPPRHLGEPA